MSEALLNKMDLEDCAIKIGLIVDALDIVESDLAGLEEEISKAGISGFEQPWTIFQMATELLCGLRKEVERSVYEEAESGGEV